MGVSTEVISFDVVLWGVALEVLKDYSARRGITSPGIAFRKWTLEKLRVGTGVLVVDITTNSTPSGETKLVVGMWGIARDTLEDYAEQQAERLSEAFQRWVLQQLKVDNGVLVTETPSGGNIH